MTEYLWRDTFSRDSLTDIISTLYILLTSLWVGFDPMEDDRRYGFQPPQSGCRAAYTVHFISAFYSTGTTVTRTTITNDSYTGS